MKDAFANLDWMTRASLLLATLDVALWAFGLHAIGR